MGMATDTLASAHEPPELGRLRALNAQAAAPDSSAVVGVACLGLDFRFLYVNEALARMHQATPEEHIGRTVAEVIPALWSDIEPLCRSAIQTGEPVVKHEVAGDAGDGRQGHWLTSLCPVRIRDEIVGLGCLVVDVGDAVRAEEIRTAITLDELERSATANVLVVEDSRVTQAVAVRMLETCGFEAQIAENGREALQALTEQPYAAVLMDCRMPELDGYETTRAVRRREHGRRRTSIIAMTADSMQGDRERCLAAGMDEYLTKPLRLEALKDALARCISESPRGLLDGALVAELENLDGDVLTELLSLYFEQAAVHVSELSGAIGRGETHTVGATAHKLKGSSSTLGAAQVALIAAELEAAAGAGNQTAADDLLDRLRNALDETEKAFRNRVAQPISDATREASI
jgi:PAS domain S-box-containing protein